MWRKQPRDGGQAIQEFTLAFSCNSDSLASINKMFILMLPPPPPQSVGWGLNVFIFNSSRKSQENSIIQRPYIGSKLAKEQKSQEDSLYELKTKNVQNFLQHTFWLAITGAVAHLMKASYFCVFVQQALNFTSSLKSWHCLTHHLEVLTTPPIKICSTEK